MKEKNYLYGADVIISTCSIHHRRQLTYSSKAEGIMALHDPSLRKLYDLKVTRELSHPYPR